MAQERPSLARALLWSLLFSPIEALLRPTPTMLSQRVPTSTNEVAPSLFVFGLGYTGLNIARKMAARGWRVGGTVSSIEKAQKLQEPGINVYSFNTAEGPMSEAKALEALQLSTHVLVTIAPIRGEGGGDGLLRWHRDDLMRLQRLKWLGYLSSTGVYGDFQGAWVTEDDVAEPNTPIGRARLAAEQEWASLAPPLPLHTFRLAGIYGPGRSALDTLVKHGGDLAASGVSAEDTSFISRIHVDDIGLVVSLSMLHPARSPSCYNVADDRPASRFEVFRFAKGLLRPTGQAAEEGDGKVSDEESPQPSPPKPRSSRQAGSKRVSNAKVRAELLEPAGEVLHYVDYEAGLTSIARGLQEG